MVEPPSYKFSCPKCGAEHVGPGGRNRCVDCGHIFDVTPPGWKACLFCLEPIQAGAARCPHCGKEQHRTAAALGALGSMIIWGGCGVFILLFLILFIIAALK
jgi:hypothetical protein